jgi:hypothetical protein
MTRRYIVSVFERARVQYVIEAESADAARAAYLRGDAVQMQIDEHDGGDADDIADVTELQPEDVI